jgi:hypothetical protein
MNEVEKAIRFLKKTAPDKPGRYVQLYKNN